MVRKRVPGRIEFKVSNQAYRLLDPRHGLEPSEKVTDIRRDPLADHASHTLDLSSALEKPDVDNTVAQAWMSFNPFTPAEHEEITSHFLDEAEGRFEGRLSVREIVATQNLFPSLPQIGIFGALVGQSSTYDLLDEAPLVVVAQDLLPGQGGLYRLQPHAPRAGGCRWGFTIHRLPSLQFLLSSTLGIGDVSYFERSHAESLTLFYPEAAKKDLRERFEESERGDLR